MMTRTITARNVNDMLPEAMYWLKVAGHYVESRNGPVARAPGPTILEYKTPAECVLFNKERDANPFFHLMEALWMLAGRKDLFFVKQFNSNMAKYAESDGTFHGAYGNRWRNQFSVDQIEEVGHELRCDPDSRRVVMSMWDSDADLGNIGSKDIPCNTHIYFQIMHNKLDMTVLNRSNDLVWGACGANAVHFSILMQFIAGALGRAMGTYWQISNNLHVYLEPHGKWRNDPTVLKNDCTVYPTVFPIYNSRYDLGENLHMIESFVGGGNAYGNSEFLTLVAEPMYTFYLKRRNQKVTDISILDKMPECDWKWAALEWVARRDLKEQK
jgi:hypothetical protein